MAAERSYAHLVQFLINEPLACTEKHAALALSVLRGELDIEQVVTAEGIVLGPRELAQIQTEAKASVPVRQSRQREKDRIYAMVDDIAVIPIRGTLVKSWGLEPMSGRTGYDGIKAKLYDALQDDDVRGIWLDIESPGGLTSGMLDLSDAIFASNERNGGKPIWAIADETAASAAFGLGSAADKLFGPRTSLVGSVGVVAIYMNERKALEKAGVEARVFRSGPNKMVMNSIEELPDEVADRFQARIDTINEMFVSTVARNLRLSKKAVAETGGMEYMGEEARALGFLSAVASWDQAWTKFRRYLDR